MALSSTLYRFQIELSDVDRGLYCPIELRVTMHPSEAPPYLLTRVLAYALNYQDGIELTQGISATEEPAIWVKNLTGAVDLWIEVGNPAARRLHKAAKSAKAVRVYTYRDPQILLEEMACEEIHRKGEIAVFSLSPSFLTSLAGTLNRDNRWQLLHDEGEISVSVGGTTISGELGRHSL